MVTFFRGIVMHSEETTMSEIIDENRTDETSIERQLFDAKKEIADLKLQIMWLERSYE